MLLLVWWQHMIVDCRVGYFTGNKIFLMGQWQKLIKTGKKGKNDKTKICIAKCSDVVYIKGIITNEIKYFLSKNKSKIYYFFFPYFLLLLSLPQKSSVHLPFHSSSTNQFPTCSPWARQMLILHPYTGNQLLIRNWNSVQVDGKPYIVDVEDSNVTNKTVEFLSKKKVLILFRQLEKKVFLVAK